MSTLSPPLPLLLPLSFTSHQALSFSSLPVLSFPLEVHVGLLKSSQGVWGSSPAEIELGAF